MTRHTVKAHTRGTDRRSHPLRRVVSETVKDKWTRTSHLECGHSVSAPMSYNGAQPAMRRRCYLCPVKDRKAAIDAAQRPQWDDFRARHPERVTRDEFNPEED